MMRNKMAHHMNWKTMNAGSKSCRGGHGGGVGSGRGNAAGRAADAGISERRATMGLIVLGRVGDSNLYP